MLRRCAVHPVPMAMFAFFPALFLTIFLATAIASAQDDAATATVLVAKLNVRSGPGTGYARIGQVSAGDVLTVTGQTQNCGWLKVQTAKLDGWAAGQRQYVRLDTACSEIPAATAATATVTGTVTAPVTATIKATEAAPTAIPTAIPTTAPTAAPTSLPTEAPAIPAGAPAAPEVTAAPTPEAPAEDPLPPGMGCFLISNYVGPELNVTTTNKDNGRSENFKVPAGGAQVWCLDPGSYAFTIDAPPPWDDLNTDIKINAGDRFEWTINPKE